MRILMISQMVPYLPCHDGFRLIPANIIRQLHRRHEIHLISAWDGSEAVEQAKWPLRYCASAVAVRVPRPLRMGYVARGIDSRQLEESARRVIRDRRPELVHLEGGAVAPLVKLVEGRLPAILSVHDSPVLRYRDFMAHALNWRARAVFLARSISAWSFERRWVRMMDRVVVTSPFDAAQLQRSTAAQRVICIPNGVDLEHFGYEPTPEAGRIVFTGNMSWPPNEDAAEYFVQEIFPTVRRRHEATFWIVGASPSERVRRLQATTGVHVTGTVPDIRSWVRSAAVYVSPLRFGMGIKNKILEAMALGTPIVATSRSLTGTPLIDGQEAIVADRPGAMAEAVGRLLEDAALANSLRVNARRKIEREYSWESVAARYEGLYAELKEDPPRRGSTADEGLKSLRPFSTIRRPWRSWIAS